MFKWSQRQHVYCEQESSDPNPQQTEGTLAGDTEKGPATWEISGATDDGVAVLWWRLEETFKLSQTIWRTTAPNRTGALHLTSASRHHQGLWGKNIQKHWDNYILV